MFAASSSICGVGEVWFHFILLSINLATLASPGCKTLRSLTCSILPTTHVLQPRPLTFSPLLYGFSTYNYFHSLSLFLGALYSCIVRHFCVFEVRWFRWPQHTCIRNILRRPRILRYLWYLIKSSLLCSMSMFSSKSNSASLFFTSRNCFTRLQYSIA